MRNAKRKSWTAESYLENIFVLKVLCLYSYHNLDLWALETHFSFCFINFLWCSLLCSNSSFIALINHDRNFHISYSQWNLWNIYSLYWVGVCELVLVSFKYYWSYKVNIMTDCQPWINDYFCMLIGFHLSKKFHPFKQMKHPLLWHYMIVLRSNFWWWHQNKVTSSWCK